MNIPDGMQDAVDLSKCGGHQYVSLKARQMHRKYKRDQNIKAGVIVDEIRKDSLHADLDVAIQIIEKLLYEREMRNDPTAIRNAEIQAFLANGGKR